MKNTIVSTREIGRVAHYSNRDFLLSEGDCVITKHSTGEEFALIFCEAVPLRGAELVKGGFVLPSGERLLVLGKEGK